MYTFSSRRLLTVGAALAVAVSLAPGLSRANAQDNSISIMVGGINKIIYLVPELTAQLGYFTDEGINVNLLDEPAGVDAETAMLAGQVDGTVGFYDHNIDLQAKGKPTMSVVQMDGVPGEYEMVSTKMADTIKSVADFKGHTFGVTSIGSSTNFLTNFLAIKGGATVDQISVVAVGAGDTFIAAMEKGQIDAGMTTEPTVSRLIQKGDAKILIDLSTNDSTKAALGGTYPAACLYMTTDYITKHQDLLQHVANAMVKTLRWIHTHTAEEIADKMPNDYYAGDKALYVAALQRSLGLFTPDGVMPVDGPPTILNVLKAFDTNVQNATIDLSKTYTTQFVDKANAALGPMPTMAATMSGTMSATMAATMSAGATMAATMAPAGTMSATMAATSQ